MPPKVEFTGDPKQLVAALDAIESKYKKLEQAIGGVAKQSKHGHSEIKEHISSHISSLATMATSYFSIEKVIDLATEAHQKWREEHEKITKRVEDTNSALAKQLSLSGNLAEMDKARAALSGITGVTKQQAIATFGGVQAGGPQLAFQQKLDIARVVAPLSLAGRDTTQVGSAAGQIATLGGMSAEQAGGIANIFQQQTGGSFDRALSERKFAPVRQLEMAGFDRNQLLAMETVAVRNQMGSVLKDLSATVLSDAVAPRGAAARGPEGKAKRLLSKMTPEERMAAITSGDESIQAGLPDKLRMAGDLFSDKNTAGLRAMYAGASTNISDEMATLSKSKTGREVTIEGMGPARTASAEHSKEETALFLSHADFELETSLKGKGVGAFGRWMQAKNFEMSRTLGMATQSPEEATIRALRESSNEDAARRLVQRQEYETGEAFMPGSKLTRGLHGPEVASTIGEESIDVLKDILRELQEQKTDKRTTATPTNPNQR